MQCYICHKGLNSEDTHPHYKRMCKSCGDINWEKREEIAKLSKYTALVTGGRVKIGYETALKLLRSGAFVIVTTRFPVDAVKRYSEENDFDNWYERLRVYQIDFRQVQALFELVNYLDAELEYLDVLINNAAQTVRYPYSYYQEIIDDEAKTYKTLSDTQKSLIVWSNTSINFSSLQQSFDMLFPIAPLQLKAGHSQNELEAYSKSALAHDFVTSVQSHKNSWTSKACDVSLVEMLEVQLINTTAPFFLCTSLRNLMELSPHKYKYIVNVSAMEGKFSKKNKNCFHPHTNMAKASLNMLTRTSAQEFIDSGILMNSVDTGWITDENPDWLRKKNELRGFIPPLDAKDGASRLCDPIFSSIIRGQHRHGLFMKDFVRTGW